MHPGPARPLRAGGRRLPDLGCALAAFAAGLAARLGGIAAKPYWMDEITTLTRSARDLRGIVVESLSFHHLPGYFLLLALLQPLGQGEAVMRFPSAVFGALACVVVFLIGSTVCGRRTGLLAAMLMALSPAQVQYGQEARSYALVTFLILVGMLGLLRLARHPGASGAPWRSAPGRAQRGAWAAYGLGTLLAVNVLGVALVWFLAANLAAVFIARAARRATPGDPVPARGFVRRWAAVNLGIAAATAPWFVAMYRYVDGAMASGLDWVPRLTPGHVWSALANVYLLRIGSLVSWKLFAAAVPALSLAVALAAAFGAWRLARRGPEFAVLGLGAALLPGLALGVSLAHPVWMPRYILWSAAPFFVLAGAGVEALPRRTRSLAAALAVLALAANLRPYYAAETKPRWDLAAAHLGPDLAADDLLLVDDTRTVQALDLYLARDGAPPVGARFTDDPAMAADWLRAGHRVWAVKGRLGQVDVESRAAFERRIAWLGPAALRRQEGRDIVVLRFDRPPPEGAGPAQQDASAAAGADD